MKETIKIFMKVCPLCLVILATACTGNYYNINKNTEEPADEDIPTWIKVGTSFQTMQQAVIPIVDNAYQMDEVLCAGVYSRYLAYAKSTDFSTNFAIFNAPDGWLNSPFNNAFDDIYPNLSQIVNAEMEAEDSREPVMGKWTSLALVLRVAAMQRITDMYGPIPYSQIDIVNANIASAYDSQKDVYYAMVDDLDKAIEALADLAVSVGEDVTLAKFDNVFNGDLIKWVKFANSLKLRIGMRMKYVDAGKAQQVCQEAVGHSVGVMLSNSDNAALSLSKWHPLYRTVVPYNDTRAAAEIICYMDGWNDARLPKYFREGDEGGYYGIRAGAWTSLPNRLEYSMPVIGEDSDTDLIWMTAAEVAFLRAEGALEGWTMGADAEDLYHQGIELSFAQNGLAADAAAAYYGDDVLTPSDLSDPVYPSNSYTAGYTLTVAWDLSDKNLNLEKIITQKWLAIYPLCHEAWAEHRRTGFPRIFPSLNNVNTDGSLSARGPSRLPFPPQERLNNEANYNMAVQLLGGTDSYGTRLWWDAKTGKPNF